VSNYLKNPFEFLPEDGSLGKSTKKFNIRVMETGGGLVLIDSESNAMPIYFCRYKFWERYYRSADDSLRDEKIREALQDTSHWSYNTHGGLVTGDTVNVLEALNNDRPSSGFVLTTKNANDLGEAGYRVTLMSCCWGTSGGCWRCPKRLGWDLVDDEDEVRS
jgi:hypothetical protein